VSRGADFPLPSSQPGSSFEQSEDKEDQAGPDHGVQDLTEHPAEYEYAYARQKPAADNGTDNTNDDITDKSEATTLHDLTGKPASNRTNHKPNNQRFDSHLLFSIETTRHSMLA
jgi:hypothetical protein